MTNDSFNEATLVVIRGTERVRLGTVTGKGTATHTVPWPVSVRLQIEINLLTASSCTTPAMQVDPGNVLDLQIREPGFPGGVCGGLRVR